MNVFVQEKRYSTSINYILSDESMFYEVGYKVLQNQDSNGFIKCVKVMHNGKIKLVYDISKYKELETVLQNSSTAMFIKIISKLLAQAINIKENGFIEYKNINTNLNSIFIDTNNLNICYIYIPIISNDERTERAFFDELKQNIIKAIDCNIQLKGSAISDLRTNLSANKALEDILRDINIRAIDKELEKQRKADIKSKKTSKVTRKHMLGQSQDIEEESEMMTKDKIAYKNPFDKLFSRKRKQEIENTTYEQNSSGEHSNFEGTTLLTSDKNPRIALKGINAPVEFSISINKPKFSIGSSSEYADGVISFNKAISRKHCSILSNGGIYFVVDEGSLNGTFVNGTRLDKNAQEQIVPGDIIKLANSEFMIVEVR